jgi:glycosyltransferase involved in cell wall biosynthesis
MQLRIGAKLPRSERRYFKERLEPQIDGTQIRLIGEVNDEAKQPFLAGAAALLFPIDWPEPFGLVMIEAMACGTPVIAFRSGSVPEVIDEGVTGFVVDDEEQAIQAVTRLGELDRGRVREWFERRFTAGRMAADYVSHYQSVVNGGAVARTLQEAGIVRYARGKIEVLDVEGLEDSACECYEAVKQHYRQLVGASPSLP